MSKYLDETGLGTLVSNIKSKFVPYDGNGTLKIGNVTASGAVQCSTITVDGVRAILYKGTTSTGEKVVAYMLPYTEDQAVLATTDYVQEQVAKMHPFEYMVWGFDALPTPGESTMYQIYLKDNGGSGQNTKDEYITIRTGSEGSYSYKWEKLGSMDVDLSGYAKLTDGSQHIVAGSIETTTGLIDAGSGITTNFIKSKTSGAGNLTLPTTGGTIATTSYVDTAVNDKADLNGSSNQDFAVKNLTASDAITGKSLSVTSSIISTNGGSIIGGIVTANDTDHASTFDGGITTPYIKKGSGASIVVPAASSAGTSGKSNYMAYIVTDTEDGAKLEAIDSTTINNLFA